MERPVMIAQIIAALKQSLVKPEDFIELWLINDLVDDENHLKLIKVTEATPDPYSVLRSDHEVFNQLNEPHGVYGEKHIKVDLGNTVIYISTDAIYRIAAPSSYIDELNRRFDGVVWKESNTPGYATIDCSCIEQAKYFNTTHQGLTCNNI